MKKPAPFEHPIHPLLVERWSPRAFSDRLVSKATLRQLFEAARWSASCFNEQPWRLFVSFQGDTAFNALVESMTPGNRVWAAAAPVLILVAAQTRFQHNGKPNRHAWYDTGQAMANLSLQATELDLFLHQMAGFDGEQAGAVFPMAADQEPIALIALGYAGEADQLSEELQHKERAVRTRRPQTEWVVWS